MDEPRHEQLAGGETPRALRHVLPQRAE